MIELKRPTEDKAEMRDLFSIDGTTYQIPARPRMNIALRYLWHTKQYGEERAAAELLEELLGRDGFEALVNYDDLTAEDFAAVMTAAQEVTLGALEEAQGGSGRGRSR